MLPGGSGLDVCSQIRSFSAVPIIILTARSEDVDRILGLELGADDYVTKPFMFRELLARVRANLRRVLLDQISPDETLLRSGKLEVDLSARRVELSGERVILQPKEFDLLVFLMQ